MGALGCRSQEFRSGLCTHNSQVIRHQVVKYRNTSNLVSASKHVCFASDVAKHLVCIPCLI
jgi:hypothetical protein